MASRSVWKGFLQFSLINVPVKAYTAAASGGGGKIALNQLHAECNSRINYKKVCPTHGEVPSNEIVSGYEFSPGQYVVVDPEELEKLRTPAEKAIGIKGFVKADAVDPMYYSGKTYYLTPDGPMGQKPYALIHRVLKESKRHAFATMAWHGKEQLMLVRPMGGVLVMTNLNFATEVKDPDEFEKEVVPVDVSPDELRIARTLTDTLAVDDFDLSVYRDDYSEKMQKLIEAKIAGKQVVESPAAEEGPAVINLMEALQKSLAQAQAAAGPKKGAAAAGKPAKQVAPGTAAKAQETRKRKSS